MGRRWGKTVLGGALSLGTASQGASVAWVVPTYKNGRSLWRWAERVTSDLRKMGRASASKTERVIEFDNGGLFGVYSADNPDAIRGEAFQLVVLDEAARISEDAWSDAINPTLADLDGDAILISTPHGLNWFHREFGDAAQMMDGDKAAWTAPTSDNPSPQIKGAFEKARQHFGENSRTFKQEWRAEFLSDGVFFQNVDRYAILDQPDTPEQHAGHRLFMASDWAKFEDYSVFAIGCQTCGRTVDWWRGNQIDYTFQRERMLRMARAWGVVGVLPERNSIGEPNIELLRREVRILPGPDGRLGFNTTATTKPALIDGLAGAFENSNFLVPAAAKHELQSYEVELGDNNRYKYSAPEGQHDDWVMALAILWSAMSRPAGVGFA